MGVENLYFPHLKSVKHQKAPFGQSVSTNFVTDFSLCSKRFRLVSEQRNTEEGDFRF